MAVKTENPLKTNQKTTIIVLQNELLWVETEKALKEVEKLEKLERKLRNVDLNVRLD